MHFSTKRQRFLVNQGYSFKVCIHCTTSAVCVYVCTSSRLQVVSKLGIEDVSPAKTHTLLTACMYNFPPRNQVCRCQPKRNKQSFYKRYIESQSPTADIEHPVEVHTLLAKYVICTPRRS